MTGIATVSCGTHVPYMCILLASAMTVCSCSVPYSGKFSRSTNFADFTDRSQSAKIVSVKF